MSRRLQKLDGRVPDGPLWYRGLAQEPEEKIEGSLVSMLARLNLQFIVNGARWFKSNIVSRFNSHVFNRSGSQSGCDKISFGTPERRVQGVLFGKGTQGSCRTCDSRKKAPDTTATAKEAEWQWSVTSAHVRNAARRDCSCLPAVLLPVPGHGRLSDGPGHRDALFLQNS